MRDLCYCLMIGQYLLVITHWTDLFIPVCSAMRYSRV